MSADLCDLGFMEAAAALAAKRVSSEELTRALLDRAAKIEPQLNSLTWWSAEQALAAAREADMARAADDPRPLLGVPIAIKDLLNVKGQPCTAGSNVLKGYVAPYDATVIARLRAAGCVFVSRTNTDEFAMGGSTETSAYGTTRNPWDLGAGAGRLERRFGGGGGRAAGAGGAGVGHRREHSPAGGVLRRDGLQTDLRAGIALRLHGLRVVAGPGRADCAHGGGCGAGLPGHRRA